MGDIFHPLVLQALQMELGIRAKAWNIRVLPMYRVAVGDGRWHTADVCVVARDQPLAEAVRLPLLCVEIVSPEDRVSDMNQKVEDYLDAGVKVVWQIDPSVRKVHQMDGTSITTATQMTVPGTDILIYASELFSCLDEIEPGRWQRSVMNEI